jgi:LmbE family N-acetylglucosaminyl deacetylase
MAPTVLAIHAHPDDIEITSAGTLFLLKDAGCSLHYMTLARGDAGSFDLDRETTAQVRAREAKRAAEYLGAAFHPSVVNDMEVLYTNDLVWRALAVVREVRPDIMLLPSPEDYMEDHVTTSRVAVTAAFCRAMPNILSNPPIPPIDTDVVIYHAMPHGLRDGLRRRPVPDFYVDITAAIDRKERMLAFHASQKGWLDKTQGMDSYLTAMRNVSAEVGRMSGKYQYAEGWRRHNHLGLSRKETEPLEEILERSIHVPQP